MNLICVKFVSTYIMIDNRYQGMSDDPRDSADELVELHTSSDDHTRMVARLRSAMRTRDWFVLKENLLGEPI